MFPRGLCPDRDWCCVNSARAVARALFHSSSPYQGIVPEGTCTISFIIPNNRRKVEHQLLCHWNISYYAKLSKLMLMWTLEITLDKPWCHVMDQNHNIPDCPTFWCYNCNTNVNWMARQAFLSLSNKINSNRPNQWLYCKTTRHLNAIQKAGAVVQR